MRCCRVVSPAILVYSYVLPRLPSPMSRLLELSVTAVALSALLVVTSASGCASRTQSDPAMVAAWVRALYGVVRVERLSPPVASRLTAYAATALYAGLASVDRDLPALTGTLNGIPELPRAVDATRYDGSIVAVVAEKLVLDSLLREGLPTTHSAIAQLADSLKTDRVSHGVIPAARARSDSLGRRVGLAIVAWSRADGFDATRGRQYLPPAGDSLWFNDTPASNYATQNESAVSEFVALDNPANHQRAGNVSDRGLILSRPKPAAARTLPAVNISGATEPYWHELRPFALRSWNACPLPQPPQYGIDSSSALFANARTVYQTKQTLTAAQRITALYWADNAGETGTPVGHWLSIAGQMISERQLSTNSAARLVLATAVAQADAYIAAWGYKYQFNLLRPRSYIRRMIDSAWEPQIPTPPFPEHPAGHSSQSSAAASVMTALLGVTPFTDSTSVSLGHAVRAFASFQAASEEAGQSRIYGGIHYPSGNRAGLALGRCIGDTVSARLQLTRVE